LEDAEPQLLGTDVPMASNSDKQTDFSAADAALGYLYQVRLALLSSLQRLRQGEVFAAYLETLDDVVFEQSGSALELLQLKHHCDRTANLTDASADLWKSFRVWIEGRTDGRIPSDARLYLITTASVGTGSAASYLTVKDRDEAKALDRLQSTARTSESKANGLAYKLFRGLSPGEKLEFVGSIVVVSKAPNISSVQQDLRKEARLVVRRDHLDSFLSRLEGWWYRRTVAHLFARNTSPILSSEIESEIDDLREQFKHDALPVDSDIFKAEVEATAYENTAFVRQVKLAGIGSRRILAAIRDYYRAFEQRSRWVREDLLLVGELDRYEQLLKEE
jgi:hypothetical protein